MGFFKGFQMLQQICEYRSNDLWTHLFMQNEEKITKSFCLQYWSAFWNESQCLTGRVSFWVKFPAVQKKTPVKYRGGGEGRFGIDWFIKTERTAHLWPVIVTGRKSMNAKNNAFFILFVTSKIWKQIYTQHQKAGDEDMSCWSVT